MNPAARIPRWSALALAMLVPVVAAAQGAAYPSRPVRVVVAFAPGGIADVAALPDVPAAADVKERLAALGFEPVGGSPAQFAAYLKKELANWAQMVKKTGARVD